jgi:hypothetical protein
VSAPPGEIDWAAAEREERRRQWWAWPFLFAFFLGMALVRGGFAFWSGRAGWVALGIYLGAFAVLMAASLLVPRLREGQASAYRVQAAVRRHADPGPEFRARADRMARLMSGRRWIAYLVWLGPAGMLLGGRWDHPLPTALGAVLLLVSTAAWSLWWLRFAADARRWQADPPGPPREMPPVTRAERWTSGRRVVWILLAVLVLAFVGGLLAVLLG